MLSTDSPQPRIACASPDAPLQKRGPEKFSSCCHETEWFGHGCPAIWKASTAMCKSYITTSSTYWSEWASDSRWRRHDLGRVVSAFSSMSPSLPRNLHPNLSRIARIFTAHLQEAIILSPRRRCIWTGHSILELGNWSEEMQTGDIQSVSSPFQDHGRVSRFDKKHLKRISCPFSLDRT